MREALFIKKGKDRWQQTQQEPATDPDEMAVEFTQLVDDLSYAKTFYPFSKITGYLNAQAAKIYLSIYQNRKEDSNRIYRLVKYDLPLTIRRHHLALLFCLLVFVLFFTVGAFSAATDENFVRDMLGDQYVAMTEENIKNGNPFGVYQYGNSFIMWLGIMINNILVSFGYFAEGVVFCIFTIKRLAEEALSIGAFEYMFYKHGLGAEFILAVFIHGTLELFAIVVAATSGVVLGKGWLFPGEMTRLDAFKQSAKDGLKLIVATVPVLMVAAFFEGFVTRYYRMPVFFNLLILISSAAFIIWYFVIYPIKVEKMVRKKLNEHFNAAE